MKYIHNVTQQIFNGDAELRYAYSDTSFPEVLDAWALEYCNVSIVTEIPSPIAKPNQRVEFDGVKLVNGNWRDTWKVLPLCDDPDQQARVDAEMVQTQLNEMKSKRQQLLGDTDCLVLPDVPITAECRTQVMEYRQKLRDIFTVQTDPYNIIWPTKPDYIKSV